MKKQEYKVGDVVVVTDNTSGHSYVADGSTKYEIISRNGVWFQLRDVKTSQIGNNITAAEIEHPAPRTKEYFEQQKAELAEEINRINGILAWMEQTGVTEYDETEQKAWQILQEVNSAKTDVEKAKAIANIVNGL